MIESFLLLFFKKEVLFFFEKKNQKTFVHFLWFLYTINQLFPSPLYGSED